MADRAISALPMANTLTETDLFVVSQGNQAKQTKWQTIIGYLTTALDGHGGISDITYTAPSSGSLDGTLTITMTDETEVEVTIKNGKGISSITPHWAVSTSNSTAPVSGWSTSMQTMTTTNKYLWQYDTYTYNDNSTANTTPIVVGVYGNTGETWYVHIKYSAREPAYDSDMSDIPDAWIGLYSGTSATAPTTYTSYTWYEYKGDAGDPAEINTELSKPQYQASTSGGPNIPAGTWTDTIPYVAPGDYLWTKVPLTFNSGSPVVYYTVSRQGVDGQGSAGTATPLADNTSGSVGTSQSFSREDHRHPLPTATDIVTSRSQTTETELSALLTYEPLYVSGTINSSSLVISNAGITADMRVIYCTINTPSRVTSRTLGYTTESGRITFSGTLSGATTISVILAKTN